MSFFKRVCCTDDFFTVKYFLTQFPNFNANILIFLYILTRCILHFTVTPGEKKSATKFTQIAGISDKWNIFLQNSCRDLQSTWEVIWTIYEACIKPLNELHVSSKCPAVFIFLQNPCRNLQNTCKIIFLKVFRWFFLLGTFQLLCSDNGFSIEAIFHWLWIYH